MKLLQLFNDYAQQESLPMIYDMNELDDFFSDSTATDIIAMTSKDFNIHARFFTFIESAYTSIDEYEMKEIVEQEFTRDFFEFIADNIEIHEYAQDDADDTFHTLSEMITAHSRNYDSMTELLNAEIAHADNKYTVRY